MDGVEARQQCRAFFVPAEHGDCIDDMRQSDSASLSGNCNANDPPVVWDIVVVSHEIGHNFNSSHTHCYGGIGGNPSPIDQCYSTENSCHVGTTSLPGPTGQGAGTMVSYCHLLAGGLSNISLNFSTGHPYGVRPIRMPNRMQAHVQKRAALVPASFVNPIVIYANGFECADGSPGCDGGADIRGSHGAIVDDGPDDCHPAACDAWAPAVS